MDEKRPFKEVLKQAFKINIFKLLIVFGGAIIVAVGLQLLLYGTYLTYETVSNVTFVLGIILFFSSLIAVTGAYEAMYGIRYALRTLYDWNYRKEVKNIQEYREKKTLKKENQTTTYKEILIVGIILIVTAIVFGGMM